MLREADALGTRCKLAAMGTVCFYVGSDRMLVGWDALGTGCSEVGSDGIFSNHMLQEQDGPNLRAMGCFSKRTGSRTILVEADALGTAGAEDRGDSACRGDMIPLWTHVRSARECNKR